jgi:hypothetical protein
VLVTRDEQRRGADPGQGRCVATWGTVHGIARLATLHQIPAAVPEDQSDLIREAVETLYDGWQRLRPS